MYKHVSIVIFAVVYALPALSQNLIKNPSFEEYTSCPDFPSQVERAKYWAKPDEHTGTSDYFNKCNNGPYVSVPKNFAGNVPAKDGDAYCGQYLAAGRTYTRNYREYIQGELKSALEKDVVYMLSFSYKLGTISHFTVDNYGVLFTENAVKGQRNSKPLLYTPQFEIKNFLKMDSNWIQIKTYYKAQGGEKYITFGSFSTDQNTQILRFDSTPNATYCYIYIDDLVLRPSTGVIFPKDTIVLCEGDSILLDASHSNASYLWQDGSKESSLLVRKPGTYWVTRVHDGKTVSDTVEVLVLTNPIVDLGPDTTICSGDTLSIKKTPTAWNIKTNLDSSNGTYQIFMEGFYFLQVFNKHCMFSDEKWVRSIETPKDLLLKDTSICEGVYVSINLPKADGTYEWFDGKESTFHSFHKQGKYWVTLRNQCDTISDTFYLKVDSLTSNVLGPDTTLCNGQTLKIVLDTFPESVYWKDVFSKLNQELAKEGTYWIQYSVKGCNYRDTIRVSVETVPTPLFDKDVSICAGDSFVFLPPTGDDIDYLWSDGSTNSTLLVTEAGKYWLKVNTANCETSDTVMVYEKDCPPVIVMPNIFIPDNDGLNERFVPIELYLNSQASLSIFNRWGNLMYHTTDLQSGWDGRSNGVDCPEANYFWVIEYEDHLANKTKHLSGTVLLIR